MSATARRPSRSSSYHAERKDHYQALTDSIIAALESGTKPWQRPWNPDLAGGSAMSINAVTGRRYHGINVLVLSMTSFAMGGDPRFCTYQQAASKGWQVKAGSKGTTVFFFKQLRVIDNEAPPPVDGADDATRTVPLMRTFTVFNGSQIEGIPAFVPPTVAECPWLRPDAAQVILDNSRAVLRIGGEKAFYAPGPDFVQMPIDGSFKTPEAWASVLLHELGHWTGHKSRLDRDLQNRFGTTAYAQEELRAELASVFLGAELNLPCSIENHANYVGDWIKRLREDKREIFRAASDAQKIADYLLAFHPDYAAAAADEPAHDD